MEYNRMKKLLKQAIEHIENFEEDESANVLEGLGFTKSELKEIKHKIIINPEDKDNLKYVDGHFYHNGEIIWNLTDVGEEWIYSDQEELDEEDWCDGQGFKTNNVPFKNYSHYIYYNEYNDHYVCYAWYEPDCNYVEEFTDKDEALDWLTGYEEE